LGSVRLMTSIARSQEIVAYPSRSNARFSLVESGYRGHTKERGTRLVREVRHPAPMQPKNSSYPSSATELGRNQVAICRRVPSDIRPVFSRLGRSV